MAATIAVYHVTLQQLPCYVYMGLGSIKKKIQMTFSAILSLFQNNSIYLKSTSLLSFYHVLIWLKNT